MSSKVRAHGGGSSRVTPLSYSLRNRTISLIFSLMYRFRYSKAIMFHRARALTLHNIVLSFQSQDASNPTTTIWKASPALLSSPGHQKDPMLRDGRFRSSEYIMTNPRTQSSPSLSLRINISVTMHIRRSKSSAICDHSQSFINDGTMSILLRIYVTMNMLAVCNHKPESRSLSCLC